MQLISILSIGLTTLTALCATVPTEGGGLSKRPNQYHIYHGQDKDEIQESDLTKRVNMPHRYRAKYGDGDEGSDLSKRPNFEFPHLPKDQDEVGESGGLQKRPKQSIVWAGND